MTLAQTISHRAAVACVGLLCFGSRRLPAAETWQSALQQMPLATRVTRLNQTNCVPLILSSFQSNAVVKALIFMPGATDEFYMFHRAGANLTNPAPSVLNALLALTNQSLIRLTFRPPLLLLHTDEDPLEPIITIGHQRTAQKLQQRPFAPAHLLFLDRDWDSLQPILKKEFKTAIRPWRFTFDSWHFYRHSFAGWGLTDWETLEALTLAGKSKATVRRGEIVFEGDARVRAVPRLGKPGP